MKFSEPAKKLRDFQEDATRATFEYFDKHTGNPLVCVPVGGGKSLLIAEFIRRANMRYGQTRFVVLSHAAKLLKQDAAELLGQWPECNISFCCDKLGRKNLTGDVVFASIQSIYAKAHDFNVPVPDMILVDEAQLLSDHDESMYRKFIADMLVINPYIKVIGYTGTEFRSDSGYLHMGKNALFTDIAYKISIIDLINMGYLTPVITPPMQTRLSAKGVAMRGGDFVQGQLEKAVDKDELTKACIDEVVAHGANRNKWFGITAGIKHCEHVRDEIRSRGIKCEMVTGKTKQAEVDRILHEYEHGDVRALVNVACLNVGFNVPSIDLLFNMRPMRSPVMYIQSTGRAMRLHEGKKDALFLDFGGTVDALGCIDQVHVATKIKGEGEAPVKYCPECNAECHAAVRNCPDCNYEFPEPELKIDKKASNAAILSTQIKPETYPVTHVMYFAHKKEGKPVTLRVEYLSGALFSFREWICLEHNGYAREKACKWWRERSDTQAPNKVSEALERKAELRKPTEIEVRKVGKYWDIIGYKF